MTKNPARLIGLLALALAAITLTACGGSSKPAPAPGSPDKPLVAQRTQLGAAAASGRSNEGAAAPTQAKPGYESLVRKQSSHPRSRFTPCNLVTAAQARAIVGAPMLNPVEAHQGPTCIYRSRNGKSMVTLAVQAFDFKKLKPHIHQRQRVALGARTAYCGTYGQPMLYAPLADGRVLTVAAQCAVAKQFASRAVRQLTA
jgi:hypothetical protein